MHSIAILYPHVTFDDTAFITPLLQLYNFIDNVVLSLDRFLRTDYTESNFFQSRDVIEDITLRHDWRAIRSIPVSIVSLELPAL